MPASRMASEQERLAPDVGAGLERHVQGRALGVGAPGAGVLERGALGVLPPELGVKALADHLAAGADEHGANQWVGADRAASALGELQRPAHVSGIRFGTRRGHRGPHLDVPGSAD